MTPIDTSVVAPDGTKLAIRRWGRDPSVVFVHGLASNARLWDGLASIMADRGVDSIAMDQRGHGRSDRPGTGFDHETLAGDILTVVGDLGPVTLVGQSWGGNVVLETAARHPDAVRAVACVDGGFIRLRNTFADLDTMLAELAPPRFDGLRPEELDALVRARHADWPESGIQGQLANFETRPDGTVGARLSRDDHLAILRHLWDSDPLRTAVDVSQPVLVIAVPGSHHAKPAAVARLGDALANGQVLWLEGDHDIHAEQPEALADELLRFLRELS